MRESRIRFSHQATRKNGRLGKDFHSDFAGSGRIENALAQTTDVRENMMERQSLLARVIFYEGSAFFKDKTLTTQRPINDALINGIGGSVLAELVNKAIRKNL